MLNNNGKPIIRVITSRYYLELYLRRFQEIFIQMFKFQPNPILQVGSFKWIHIFDLYETILFFWKTHIEVSGALADHKKITNSYEFSTNSPKCKNIYECHGSVMENSVILYYFISSAEHNSWCSEKCLHVFCLYIIVLDFVDCHRSDKNSRKNLQNIFCFYHLFRRRKKDIQALTEFSFSVQ